MQTKPFKSRNFHVRVAHENGTKGTLSTISISALTPELAKQAVSEKLTGQKIVILGIVES